MANASADNVMFIDTDNTTIPGPVRIKSIKYIGASTSSVSLKQGTTSGTVLWTENASTNVFNGEVCIRTSGDVFVDITGTAAIYVYLE